VNLPIYAAGPGAFLIILQVGLMLNARLHRSKGRLIGNEKVFAGMGAMGVVATLCAASGSTYRIVSKIA